jgi:hypothetical protein
LLRKPLHADLSLDHQLKNAWIAPELYLRSSVARQRKSISSNLAVGLILGVFVGLVVISLVVVYILPSGSSPASHFSGVSLSGITLYSGPGSTESYSQGCNVNEAQLEIYASNNSSSTVNLANVTFYGGSLSRNGTGLVPVSSGCLPISQSPAPVSSGSDDLAIDSYPSVPMPLGTSCNVLLNFNNGQNFTQLVIAQAE